MPQFDPTFFAPQLFWLFATFIVLYVLMSRLAMPKIGAVLEERQRKIDDNLDKATQLRAEAEAAIALHEKALAEARQQAHDVLRACQETLAKRADDRSRELSERLAGQVREGEARILAAKEQALAHVLEIAADIAQTAAAKLTGQSVEAAEANRAVGAVIEENR